MKLHHILYLGVFFLISICEAINEFTEDFYNDWVEKYRAVSGNEKSPKRYRTWIQEVSKMGVSIEPSTYKQAFEQIKYFKGRGTSVAKMREHYHKILALFPHRKDIKLHTLKDLMYSQELRVFPRSSNLDLLPLVMDPNIECSAIFHRYDEGMLVPADDSDRSYTDMKDVFRRSESLRNSLGEYADKNMHLQAPASFILVPYDSPIFSMDRLIGAKDLLYAHDQTGILHYERHMHYIQNASTWETRRNTAVFRGAANGIDFGKCLRDNIPLTNNPRFKLYDMSLKQKEGKLQSNVTLDFGINDIINSIVAERLHPGRFRNSPVLNYNQQFKNKYSVVVDGHGWPDRVAFMMASGSLVFLATVHEDWTINQIIPDVHYIRVKPDLSDLIEKLEWAYANDAEAKRIAVTGKEFALNHLRRNNVKAYNGMLFMEYQTLFE